jgi:hypothetical protein
VTSLELWRGSRAHGRPWSALLTVRSRGHRDLHVLMARKPSDELLFVASPLKCGSHESKP